MTNKVLLHSGDSSNRPGWRTQDERDGTEPAPRYRAVTINASAARSRMVKAKTRLRELMEPETLGRAADACVVGVDNAVTNDPR